MALKFNIKSTQDCGKLKYTNCSTYCSPDNYITNLLVASIKPEIQLFGNNLQLTTDILTSSQIDSVTWDVNGVIISSTNIPTNTGVVQFIQTLPLQTIPVLSTGINYIVMTVEDVNGLTSELTFAIKVDINFNIVWVAIPELSITTGNNLEVQFNDNSTLVNTNIDLSTIDFSPDSVNNFSSVQNFTYSLVDTYTLAYSFYESEDNTLVSLSAIVDIIEDDIDCNSQLTESDISSVILTATSPKGTTYTTEITNNFTTLTTFDVLASSFGSFSTFESGIWTFQTIVTKVTNTGTFIFADTVKLVIICKEECGFNAYVAAYAEEEADCCSDCKVEKEKKIILMQTYIDAIKNASACGELNKITKFINLLQRLLSNKNCSC